MNCPNCKQEIPEDKKFCGHCGHKLVPAEPKVPPPASVSPQPKRALPSWAWGLGGGMALIILILIIWISSMSGSQPEPIMVTEAVGVEEGTSMGAEDDYQVPTRTSVKTPKQTEIVVLPIATREKALGTEEDPIVWAVVPSGETERVVSGFEEIAAMIYDETGLVITPFVATEYAGVIEAMCSDPAKAHMGSLATFAYILAADRGCAEAALVSVRYGSAVYNGQIFVRADSGITSIEELAGKTFCRPDPLSTSGWIIPSITLKAAGIDPDTDLAQVVDAGSHDASIAGVYNGDCDAGSSYVDARTRVEEDYPDVMDVITVIEISADIPNDGVQFVTSFDADMKDQIVAALLAIAETEEGVAALGEAYQWNALEEQNDTFYDAFRQVLDAAGVSAEDF